MWKFRGIYTTVEGLIGKVRESLIRANPFPCGDAAVFDESSPNIRHHQPDTNDTDESVACTTSYSKYKALLQKLEDMASGDLMPFTLILTDPMASSFVGPIPAITTEINEKMIPMMVMLTIA